MEPTPTELAIVAAKDIRVGLDGQLQKLKCYKDDLIKDKPEGFKDYGEVLANVTLSIRHVEDSIMRLGMVMKNIGGTNPYPNSYNTGNAIVEPTADGLKL